MSGDSLASTGDAPPTQLERMTQLVAHELKNPLAVVVAASDALVRGFDDADPDEVRRLLQVIDRNGRLAVLLVNRLTLARDVEAGTVELRTEAVDLAGIVRESVGDLAHVVLRDHPATVTGADEVPIVADATALREIVLNLLANAAKYSEAEAPIDIRVGADATHAELVVRNHGSGVTPGDTERIFDAYYQSDDRSSGIGLGLFISRGLARAHGGDLGVRPAEEVGSEFVLRLPATGPSNHDEGQVHPAPAPAPV